MRVDLVAAVGDSTVAIGSLAAGLVTAFGYALFTLTKGTDRIDRASLRQVETLTAELDRARADFAGRIRAVEAERDGARAEANHWRDQAYRFAGAGSLPEPFQEDPTP